jgi:hypothetical protein
MKTWLVMPVIWTFSFTQFARAVCSQPQPRLVCAEFSASKVVVEATLLKIDDVLYKNDPKAVIGRYYTLKADPAFRGTPEQTIRVYEGNDSGRVSFVWKVGTKYLLFLFDSIEKPTLKVLALDGCGNSGPVARSAAVLGNIARINQQLQTGLIAGMVSVYNLSGPVPDVQVEARGGGKVYKASTDRKGRFQIEVPPGEYTVAPVQPLSFQVFDLSYEDPRDLKIQPGGCAQVQFIETSHR